ncbi:hypothetical protein ACFLZO_01325 [Patescibacteria group bacterium]
MGLSESTVEMIAMFIMFVYANATSMLVAGFICWFIGRMGSVNPAVPRVLPQLLHVSAALLFAATTAGLMALGLIGGNWVIVLLASVTLFCFMRNISYAIRVPRRITVETASFEEPPPPALEEPLPKEGGDHHAHRS